MVSRFLLSIFVLIACSNAFATTAQRVNDWFDNQNYANVTEPGIYEGQSARYGSLGGISTRAPITRPFQLLNIQTPRFSAGCGGIDFYAGGFSAIDADQFVENLRSIGENAQSLAFMLAIQIVTPQLSGVMERINTWAQMANKMSMDSCEAAKAIVGGTMEAFGQEEGNCIVRAMNDFGDDYTQASHRCTTGGDKQDIEGDEPNEVDFVEGNLAWFVMMQDPFFAADLEFSQLVMNITGTIIIDDINGDSDSGNNLRHIPSAIGKEGAVKERFTNIYNALYHGNEADTDLFIYECTGPFTNNTNSCLDVSAAPENVNPNWEGLYPRVKDILASILAKIQNDVQLDPVELGLISSSSLPLYRFLQAVHTRFNINVATNHADTFATTIADDILLRGLLAVVEQVNTNSLNLQENLSDATKVKDFRESLQGIMGELNEKIKENKKSAEEFVLMQERITTYERELLSKLGGSRGGEAGF